MKRIVLAVLLVMSIASMGVGSAYAKSTPLDGRLGGKQATFEKRLGKNTGQDEKIKGLGYESKGYGLIVVTYSSGTATNITLAPVRGVHAAGNEFDEADWDQTDYAHVVRKFLPTDGSIIGLVRQTGDGRHEGACHSDSLGKAFSKSAWKKLHASGSPGDCHFLLAPDANNYIYQIEISFGQSGSLDNAVAPAPQIPASNTSQSSVAAAPIPTETPSEQPSVINDDEIDYIATVSNISNDLATVSSDLVNRFEASDIGSNSWLVHVAADFVVIRNSYTDFQAVVPPVAFENHYSLFLQALQYANQATYDYEYGIDNLDASSIQLGNSEFELAADFTRQANAELSRIKNERDL